MCTRTDSGDVFDLDLQVDLRDPEILRLAQVAEKLVPGGAEKWKAHYVQVKKIWATRVMAARKAGIDEKALLDKSLPQPTADQRRVMMYEHFRLTQKLSEESHDDFHEKLQNLKIQE